MNTNVSSDKQSLAPATAAMALVPLGILINLGIGTIVHLLKLPLFIDSVGTILITILIGIRWGAVTGVLSFLVGGVIVNPVMPYFSATQAGCLLRMRFQATDNNRDRRRDWNCQTLGLCSRCKRGRRNTTLRV